MKYQTDFLGDGRKHLLSPIGLFLQVDHTMDITDLSNCKKKIFRIILFYNAAGLYSSRIF